MRRRSASVPDVPRITTVVESTSDTTNVDAIVLQHNQTHFYDDCYQHVANVVLPALQGAGTHSGATLIDRDLVNYYDDRWSMGITLFAMDAWTSDDSAEIDALLAPFGDAASIPHQCHKRLASPEDACYVATHFGHSTSPLYTYRIQTHTGDTHVEIVFYHVAAHYYHEGTPADTGGEQFEDHRFFNYHFGIGQEINTPPSTSHLMTQLGIGLVTLLILLLFGYVVILGPLLGDARTTHPRATLLGWIATLSRGVAHVITIAKQLWAVFGILANDVARYLVRTVKNNTLQGIFSLISIIPVEPENLCTFTPAMDPPIQREH